MWEVLQYLFPRADGTAGAAHISASLILSPTKIVGTGYTSYIGAYHRATSQILNGGLGAIYNWTRANIFYATG